MANPAEADTMRISAAKTSRSRRGAGVSYRAREPRGGDLGGFTLVELVIVITLVGIISAIALPQLMPAIMVGRLEGAARHLAGYGSSATAYATLMRETIVVKFDLDHQEYWTVRRSDALNRMFLEEEAKKVDEAKDAKKPGQEDKTKKTDVKGGDFLNLFGGPHAAGNGEMNAQDEANLMRDQFNQFVRMHMLARAKQVKRGGILDEIGPLFDKKFSLTDEEKQDEELKDSLLIRAGLPEGVEIEEIWVGSVQYRKGEAEIEVTPVGLMEPVGFYVKNGDDDYFTVTWDAVTGGGRVERGKKEIASSIPTASDGSTSKAKESRSSATNSRSSTNSRHLGLSSP